MICEVKDARELTQAVSQNKHKAMAEVQRVNLFHYFTNQGCPKATPGQRQSSRNTGTVRLSPSWQVAGSGSSVSTNFSRACTHVVYHCAVISSLVFVLSTL